MASKLALALCLSGAAAYVAPVTRSSSSALAGGKEDLLALADSLPGPGTSFWDPLGLADQDYALGNVDATVGNDATVAFLRHAEIKHGRVAMAAFLGYLAQCTDLVKGEHTYLPYRGYVAGCTPQEQWDNIPLYGKLQIFTLIGMLESYGEGAGQPDGYVHYMRGGQPGDYPKIKGRGGPGGHFLFNLWDPFQLVTRRTKEENARGLKCEILNGRAAMFGILGLLAESAEPGSVPFLSAIEGFPRYAGDVMAPFSGDFTLGLGN